MILLHEHALKDFNEYGIAIPQSGDRALGVYRALLDHERLGPLREHWLYSGEMDPITRHDLVRVHAPEYVDQLLSDHPEPAIMEAYELDKDDLTSGRYAPDRATKPLQELVVKSLANVSGTHQACRQALQSGFCYFLGGGMHHAMHSRGRGFCLLNDIVIAIRKLRAEGRIERAWIIDVDAHKGDGTAALCLEDEQTMTLSIHMARGWPLDSPAFDEHGRLQPWRYPSTVDIPIEAGGEEFYLDALEHGLRLLFALCSGKGPDLVVVVDGSDPYEHDELPGTKTLKLNREELYARDMFLYDWFKRREISQAYLMAGGYGKKSWQIYASFLIPVLLDRYARE